MESLIVENNNVAQTEFNSILEEMRNMVKKTEDMFEYMKKSQMEMEMKIDDMKKEINAMRVEINEIKQINITLVRDNEIFRQKLGLPPIRFEVIIVTRTRLRCNTDHLVNSN